MPLSKHPSTLTANYLLIAAIVVLAGILLFSLDKDMHAPSDFVKFVNVVALLVYTVPTTALCYGLFYGFSKKHNRKKSRSLSLLIGIPVGFALVIFFFLITKY